jgi:hypothetical protein
VANSQGKGVGVYAIREKKLTAILLKNFVNRHKSNTNQSKLHRDRTIVSNKAFLFSFSSLYHVKFQESGQCTLLSMVKTRI